MAVAAITLTYVAVTVGESILAPILPIASSELGLGGEQGGRILGLIAIAAGVGNLGGGLILSRFGTKVSSLLGLALTVIGAAIAAIDGGIAPFAVAHALMGLGAGVFFAGGIYAIGVLADPTRRGRAMGVFGIAYSLAQALAAGLVAAIGSEPWRATFAVAVGLGVVAILAVATADLPPKTPVPRPALREGIYLLGVPVAVGGVAAVAQFGLVAFLPTLAVDSWATTASVAAAVLLAGRVLSIPAKVWAGRLVDRRGSLGAARLVTVTLVASGIFWLGSPFVWLGAVAAVVFAAASGAMFPVANVVAVERFGSRAGLLGLFRSAQMAVAGLAAWLVGLGASLVNLRLVLAIGVAGLAALLLLSRGDQTSS